MVETKFRAFLEACIVALNVNPKAVISFSIAGALSCTLRKDAAHFYYRDNYANTVFKVNPTAFIDGVIKAVWQFTNVYQKWYQIQDDAMEKYILSGIMNSIISVPFTEIGGDVYRINGNDIIVSKM